MSADPNGPAAAFAEYAADSWWVGTHLGQFVGTALLLSMPSGVLLLAWAFVLGIAMWRHNAPREAERRTPVESSTP